MKRKILFIIFISIFGLSSFAIANSDKKENNHTRGKPFKRIWNVIKDHEERIVELETKISNVVGNFARYTVDFQKCLNSSNSEAVITYANGTNMSQTLIWNCADYEYYGDQHIELFFTSNDGECFKLSRTYINEGSCESPYIPPENPLFEANIKDFTLQSSVLEECGPPGPFQHCDYYYYIITTYSIENIGNTTLFNLSVKVDYDPYLDKDFISVLPVGESTSESSSAGAGINITQPKTYTVTVSVEMWDGTILDSQSKTITVNP